MSEISEQAPKKERPKLSNLAVLSYGLCEMSSNMSASIATQYFAFFITDILGINAAVMATILVIARLGDFITILLSSIVVEKVNMKWGKFRSFLLVCAPIAWVFFLAQYIPIGLPSQTRMVIAATCYVVSFGIFNFGRTATMALLNVMGRNQEEKAMLSARKGQFSSFSPLIFGAAFLPLALLFSGAASTGSKTDVSGLGFFLAAFVFYTFYLVVNLIFFKATKPYDLPGEYTEVSKKTKMTVGEMLSQIVKNVPLMLLLVAETVKTTANSVITSGAIYYFRVVARDLTLQPIYSTVSSLVGIGGALILGQLINKIGKRNLALVGSVMQAVVLLGIRFIAGSSSVWTFIVLMGVGRFAFQGIQVCGVGMFGDCVEYGKSKLGKEARGFIMGLYMFPIKLGTVLGAPLLSSALVAAKYSANAEITAEMQLGVFNMITFVPAVLFAIAAVLYMLYPLSNKKMKEIYAATEGN